MERYSELSGEVLSDLRADLVVAGGLVVDGTGAAPVPADVLVRDGLVLAVVPTGASDTDPSTRVVDARGRMVAPGFVDIHTHSDLTVLSSPAAPSKLRQGVTTEVVGNCGLGITPRLVRDGVPDSGALARGALGYLDLDDSVPTPGPRVRDYLDVVREARPALGIAAFAAHLALRASCVGLSAVTASAAQLADMRAVLADGLADGAVGLSTGLVYAPLCYADDAELVGLAEEVAARDRIMAWHLRDYADALLPSAEQALDVARRTGVRTQISHLVGVGRRNWGTVRRVLDLVDRALDAGLDIGVDVYPYLAGNAPLCQLLPSWAQDGGPDVFTRLLGEADARARIQREWEGHALGWEEIVVNTLPPDAAPADQQWLGSTLAAIADAVDRDPGEVCLDLLRTYGGDVMMVAFGRSSDDLADVLSHRAAVVASDGQALDPTGPTGRGLPHPRSYGTFPRYLSDFAASPEDGIRRCTSAPAARVGLRDRGTIAPGQRADLLVLDWERLLDAATFTRPAQHPEGVEVVVVGGTVAVEHGRPTGERAGTPVGVTAGPAR